MLLNTTINYIGRKYALLSSGAARKLLALPLFINIKVS